MPNEPNLEQTVTNYLKSRHCFPTPDWIQALVPAGENTSSSSTISPDLVYQTWIKLNWAEEQFKAHSLPALPADVHLEFINHLPRTLTGNYLVQITHITNISKPRDSELNVDDDEEEEEDEDENATDFGKLFKKGAKRKVPAPKGKGDPKKAKGKKAFDRFNRFGGRMLRMGLTDGHIHCLAIEYMPIPILNEDHLNVKLLLSGPFEIRAGTFLLRPQNVKIIYMPPEGPSWLEPNNNHNGNHHNGVDDNYENLLNDDWDDDILNDNRNDHQNGNDNYENLLNDDFDDEDLNANGNDNYDNLLEDDLDDEVVLNASDQQKENDQNVNNFENLLEDDWNDDDLNDILP